MTTYHGEICRFCFSNKLTTQPEHLRALVCKGCEYQVMRVRNFLAVWGGNGTLKHELLRDEAIVVETKVEKEGVAKKGKDPQLQLAPRPTET